MSSTYYVPKIPIDKKIFITSDIHGFHKNIAAGSSSWGDRSICRPFKDEFEMTNVICDNINYIVDKDDILLHLGDWSFGGMANIPKLRSMIRCKNIFTWVGNHDVHIGKFSELFCDIFTYWEFSYKGKLICACHYPIISWNKIRKNGLAFHGHSHHSLNYSSSGLLDVGIDGYGFKPISLDYAIQIAS